MGVIGGPCRNPTQRVIEVGYDAAGKVSCFVCQDMDRKNGQTIWKGRKACTSDRAINCWKSKNGNPAVSGRSLCGSGSETGSGPMAKKKSTSARLAALEAQTQTLAGTTGNWDGTIRNLKDTVAALWTGQGGTTATPAPAPSPEKESATNWIVLIGIGLGLWLWLRR